MKTLINVSYLPSEQELEDLHEEERLRKTCTRKRCFICTRFRFIMDYTLDQDLHGTHLQLVKHFIKNLF